MNQFNPEDCLSDGQRRFILGPVEMWIVGLVGLGLVALVGLLFNSFFARMNEQAAVASRQGDTLNTLVTQQAVANGQLSTLNVQLSGIPGLTDRVTKLEANQSEVVRRLGRIEDGSERAKGWTR
jgi:hypothetical protein